MMIRKLMSSASLTALCVFGTAARADVGGFMGGCYDGYFITGKVCDTRDVEGSLELAPGRTVGAKVHTEAQYRKQSGDDFFVDLTLEVKDPSNFFDPEAKLPVLVRVIARSYHRDYSYWVISDAHVLDRVQGERRLKGRTFRLDLKNGFGAEYVETIDKLEVLIPGVPGTLVLDL